MTSEAPERVWLLKRPGDAFLNEKGERMSGQTLPEGHPAAGLLANKGKARLVLAAALSSPEEKTYREAMGMEPLEAVEEEPEEDLEE